MWLQVKMYLILGMFFGVIYALLSMIGAYMGIGSFMFYGILAAVMMLIQYMIGPKIVDWSMKVKYVSGKEQPELHRMVAELAKKAKIQKPRIGISQTLIPNAFAFGRWESDSRVCVTEKLLDLLSKEELKAVLGHEIAHIKNRDVLAITLMSVVPTIAWYFAQSMIFSGARGENKGGSNIAIGIAAFAIYFLTNLLVLYASRIREYYADKDSVALGNKPANLASALYKLVYGSAKTPKSLLKETEGMKAFFANDPSRAISEFNDLMALDMDKSGSIDEVELAAIRNKKANVSGMDRFMELLSTHPNMVKRISALSELGAR